MKRDKEGNVITDGGKYTDEYSCADFSTREETQKFFKNAGDPNKDVNNLDGDNDSVVCQVLTGEKIISNGKSVDKMLNKEINERNVD